MRKLILTFILGIGLASCSSVPSLPIKSLGKNKSVSLTDSRWVLENQQFVSSDITLNIEENKISGNASCNSYFGELTLGESGEFSVQNIGTTRKHCDKMSAESFFLNVLEKANRYTATDNELKLYEGHILLLKFKKK